MNSTSTRGPAGGTRQRLLEAAQRGDPAAQEELVRRFEPLVQRVVWRLRLPPYCERDDLAQEARIGLLAAIRRWRPDRGPFPRVRGSLRHQPGAARTRGGMPAQTSDPQPRRTTRGRNRPSRKLDRGRHPAQAARSARSPARRTDRPRSPAPRPRTADERSPRHPQAHHRRAGGTRRRAQRTKLRAARTSARPHPRRARPRPPTAPAASSRPPSRPRRDSSREDIDLFSPGDGSRRRDRRPTSLRGVRHSPGGWRSTNPAGPVPTVLQRGPVDGGLGGLPSPAAVSR